MRHLRLCLGLLVSLLACACNSLPDSVRPAAASLPLNFAWVDGRKVEYITTDISDPAMAQMLGVNLVPRLGRVENQRELITPAAR